MAVPEIGLAPTFPVMVEVGTSVIAVFERSAKFAAHERLIDVGPAENAGENVEKISVNVVTATAEA